MVTILTRSVATAKLEETESETKKPEVAEATRSESGAHIKVLSYITT